MSKWLNTNEYFLKQRAMCVERLLKDDPNSFLLLTMIALRANWHDDFNTQGLKHGEALVGDYRNYGLTRQEYRGATQRLRKWQFATYRATNKGTIARLLDKRVYDINDPTQQPTTRPSSNHQATTNEENKKIRSIERGSKGFQPPTEKEVYDQEFERDYSEDRHELEPADQAHLDSISEEVKQISIKA